MKTKVTKEVVVNEVVSVIVTCDICGKTDARGSEYRSNWADGYDYEVTEVLYKTGYNYPGDGFSGTEYRYDICPTCFSQHLMPFLKKLGAKANVVDH